jgi:hypothetical protein
MFNAANLITQIAKKKRCALASLTLDNLSYHSLLPVMAYYLDRKDAV